MKTYQKFSKWTVFLSLLILGIMVLPQGCANYKAESRLNIYHPQIIEVFSVPPTIIGSFCTPQEFHDSFSLDYSMLSIVQHNTYSKYITGTISEYNEKQGTILGSLRIDKTDGYSTYQRECGKGQRYPYIYWFTINLIKDYPNDKSKKDRMKEYNYIVDQINKEKYIDVHVVNRPMVGTSVEGSAQSSHIYFTDEQIVKLFSDKK